MADQEPRTLASDADKTDSSAGPDDVIELPLETQKEISTEPAPLPAGDIDTAENLDSAPAQLDGDSPDSSNAGDDADGPESGTPDTETTHNSENRQKRKSKTSTDGISGPVVVDASDHVAGRLSSFVAKMLLQGKRVSLVNCERIMLSGTRTNTIHEYRQFLKINSIINPKHGPVHYRRPDTVITKMIRGMLPFEKKPSGKAAHKRLRAYVGSPRELKQFRKVQFEKAKITRPASSYTTMGELCRVIGWTE